MDINDTLDLKIERYLNSELSEVEAKSFEEQLATNKVLLEEVQFRRNFRFVVKHQQTIQFQAKLKDIAAATPITPDMSFNAARFGKWWQVIGITIGVVVIGIIGFQVAPRFAPKSAQEKAIDILLETNLQPFQNKIDLSDDDTSPLALGLRAYEQQDYTTAILYLSQYVNQNAFDVQPQFYLGLAYLFNNQTNNAMPYFKNVVNDDLLGIHAQWYLGLGQLKSEAVEVAKETLKGLQNTDDYKEQIKNILEELDREH